MSERRRGRPPTVAAAPAAGEKFVSRCVSLPESLWGLLGAIRRARGDAHLSQTVRALLCLALSQLGYLPEETRRAYGL